MTKSLRFLFLEPFYSGSHRDFADGFAAHSQHRIEVRGMPGRFWKWRMRGAALYLADRIDYGTHYDGLIVSGLMSLADLKALWKGALPPALLYFHENQLSYPLAPGESTDYQYGFTNITSALAADRVLFNSDFHRRTFLEALPGFIRMMPDCRPGGLVAAIATKAAVAHPGCHFGSATALPPSLSATPLVVWNHRWEHDKNPESFFAALAAMQRQGKRFQVALLGESYTGVPGVFSTARELLGERLIQFGHIAGRSEYHQMLARGAIVISTARQENFGIAVVEAIRHGCLPLLPAGLSYPEIVPPVFHDHCLYTDQSDLEFKLARLLDNIGRFDTQRRALAAAMDRFAWSNAIELLDHELHQLATQGMPSRIGFSRSTLVNP
jgi:glycosyltransferase involved in cell wall biosynthesis